MKFRPIGSTYLTKAVREPDRSAGGIWLPENRENRICEADVLSAGPGLAGDSQMRSVMRSVMEVAPGERILFQAKDWEPLGDGELGTISDESIVAVEISFYPWAEPCGEWVLVNADPPATSQKGILIPEKWRKKRRSGKVLDHGCGLLLKKGPYRCTRRSVCAILNVETVIGRVVYWEKTARLLLLSGRSDHLILVRASELIAMEDPLPPVVATSA